MSLVIHIFLQKIDNISSGTSRLFVVFGGWPKWCQSLLHTCSSAGKDGNLWGTSCLAPKRGSVWLVLKPVYQSGQIIVWHGAFDRWGFYWTQSWIWFEAIPLLSHQAVWCLKVMFLFGNPCIAEATTLGSAQISWNFKLLLPSDPGIRYLVHFTHEQTCIFPVFWAYILDLVCFHCSSWLSLGRLIRMYSAMCFYSRLFVRREPMIQVKQTIIGLIGLQSFFDLSLFCLSDINAKWWFDHGETPPCAREKNGAVGLRGPQPWQHAGWSDLDLLGIPPSEPHLDHLHLVSVHEFQLEFSGYSLA